MRSVQFKLIGKNDADKIIGILRVGGRELMINARIIELMKTSKEREISIQLAYMKRGLSN
jgi:hypothetical protein